MKDGVFSITLKIISLLIGLLLTSVFVNKYSENVLASYVLFIAIIGMIGSFDFGIKNTLKNYLLEKGSTIKSQLLALEKVNFLIILTVIGLSVFFRIDETTLFNDIAKVSAKYFSLFFMSLFLEVIR